MAIDSLIILIFVTLAFILVLALFISKNLKTRLLNLPPGSYGWPLLGETLEFLRAGKNGVPEKFIKERIEKYNSPQVFKTSLMGESMAFFIGPMGHKFLYSNENKFVRLWWPISVRKLLAPCLITKVGEEAKVMRKMVSYFVSPDVITNNYLKIMDLVTQQHLKTHWEGQEQVYVYPTLKLYTFELACRLFMSLEDPHHISKLSSLFKVFLKGLISIPLDFPGTRFHAARKATNEVRKELLNIIRERREALQAKNNASGGTLSTTAMAKQDLMSYMISTPDENGKFMPEIEVVNNILLLLFAGHDTSSSALSMIMKYLAELPQVYQKVVQEQLDIASSREDGYTLQWEDIQKMKYTWNVVSEVMRLSPPVLGSFREAIVDFKYAGYDIPKGWKLYWSAAYTHRDSQVFPNNKDFDPSRFDGVGPAPFSYVPFGGGPRMCLGKEFARLEILVFLHNLVKSFSWKLLIPDEKIEYDPMCAPANGLPVSLQSLGM
ncbi:hypothetical protein Leryth_022176 [Lithospermum erythrorhizon]|nr:hypothetical protein Leryth_022176 [Lithospermum erythrorhizon]